MNSPKKNVHIFNDWFEDDSSASSEDLIDASNTITLELFKNVAARVPAYKDFLQKNQIKPTLIKSIEDFQKIPYVSKENYIEIYDLKSRCWDGKLSDMHMISTSSGTTGNIHFWPRNINHEIEGAKAHEYIFNNILNISQSSTLFINGFAMGNWIAGTFTLACVNFLAWKGYSITSMTPGYSSEGIIEVLKTIAPQFDRVIIAGHIPFLKETIEMAIESGIDFKKIPTQLLGTGQAITERWREYVLNLLQSDDYYHSIINLYGSADVALMGFESPLSIYVRRNLAENYTKIRAFFGNERLPSLYNFDPRLVYIESESKELLFTKDGGCPLIRYNIHDEGGVITSKEMRSKMDLNDISAEGSNSNNFHLPFVYLYGRDKFMVKMYGANIYSEHVQYALSHQKLQPHITGRFLLEMDYNNKQNPEMICRIELNKNTKADDNLTNIIKEIFIEEVRKINSEYHFILEKLGEKTKPKIILHEHGYEKYFPKDKIKKTS